MARTLVDNLIVDHPGLPSQELERIPDEVSREHRLDKGEGLLSISLSPRLSNNELERTSGSDGGSPAVAVSGYMAKGGRLGVDPSLPPNFASTQITNLGGVGSSLVQYKNKCNRVDPDIDDEGLPHPCGCWVWVDGSTNKTEQVFPFRCKRWTCPRCGKVNRSLLLKAIQREAMKYGLQRFLTLTLPATIGIDPQAKVYLLKVWAKWRVYLGRRYGCRVVYLWVKERKNGRLHLHCLVDRYIPQAWISASWSALGGGRVVDIRWVDLHRVKHYLTKYLTKDFYAGVDGRHYGSSQTVDLCLRQKVDGVYHFELVRLPCHHFEDSPELDAVRDWLLSRLVLERFR